MRLGICLVFFFHSVLQAQEYSISLGSRTIGLNQPFTITLSAVNGELKKYSNFPDIQGFQKRGTSSSSSMNIVNGTVTSSQSITQNYVATKQGLFKLRPFTMIVDGKEVKSQGTTIQVGQPVQSNYQDPFSSDPFEDFFGKRQSPKEYMNVEDDAFFMVNADKKSVYRGEGFLLTAAFYIGVSNQARLQFAGNLSEQITQLLKKIKPANCWEENFEISEIQPESVTIQGKPYTRYKLYQAVMYPINAQSIIVPRVGLQMIKYKVAKNPTFFGNNLQEDYKTFYSNPFTVKVKQLPNHPLRETVPVGVFALKEDVKGKNITTGKSFTYHFSVHGEGNISSLSAPEIPDNPAIEFYTPDSKQSITRDNSKVTGTKLFSYYAIPKEPGKHSLKNLVYWVYFNPKKERYDTLQSKYTLTVTGESKKDASIQASEYDSFYSSIYSASNKFYSGGLQKLISLLSNLLLVIMLLTTGYIVIRK